ncbi:MAG TPA: DNA recombination protein RmuC [Sphingobacteriaceae bacterium]
MEGILIGIIIVFFSIIILLLLQRKGKIKSENDRILIDLAKAEEKLNILSTEKSSLTAELASEREKYLEAIRTLESTRSFYQSQKEKILEQKQEIEDLQKKLTSEFENIANRLLEEKSQKFTEQNQSNLNTLLSPLKEQIKVFEKKVDEAYDKELRDKVSLREELKKLNEMNTRLSNDATNLTNALKGETKTQGNWGELILETILEKSGLAKNREYFLQQSYSSEEGRKYQPDVIIHLPDNKRIVIDSKVSLVDFERYFSCDNEQDKNLCLKNHIASIRKHIKGLSDKNYQSLYQLQSLDFVLMFMPVEPAFSLATQHDNTLFNEAFEKNIVIVSPSTLLATLRTIASIWKFEYQNKNALKIAKEGEALYDKFHDLIKDLEKIQGGFENVQRSFSQAFTKLEGRGGIIRRIENLRELGVKGNKRLNEKYLDSNDDVVPVQEETES